MAIDDVPARPVGKEAPSFRQLWAWPIALGVLTLTGLLSALISDGWGDVWSWIALGIPVATITWFSCFSRR